MGYSSQLKAPPVGRYRMTADSVLSSSIEVGIGIAGFAGIVAAIRQRDVGAWSARDRITLQALFGSSGLAILFGLLPGILQEVPIPQAQTWRTVSACQIVWFIVVGFLRTRQMRAQGISPFQDQYYLVLVGAALCVAVLQCFNLIWGVSWPYLVGVAWLLVMGFALFLILLFRQDDRSPD